MTVAPDGVGDAVVRAGGGGCGEERPVEAGSGGHRRGRRVLGVMHHLWERKQKKLGHSSLIWLKASFGSTARTKPEISY